MSHHRSPFIPDFLTGHDSPAFVPKWMKEERTSDRVAEALPALFSRSCPPTESPEGETIILKGGRCIIPYKGIFPMDIKIKNGKILSTGTDISEKTARIIELEGKYVAPGIVDPHVHLGLVTPFDTEIVTETRSALLNGITTIGLYLGGQESYLNTLDETIRKIETLACTDVFIHLVILTRAQLEEIPLYFSRYGITSYKTYMCGIPGLIPSVEDDFLMDLMEQVASLGENAVLNIHAENHRVVSRATEKLKKADPSPVSLRKWEESHPGFAEAEAIQRASYLSKEAGATLYFVHMSSGESIRMAEELRKRYRHIFFETTSPYLTLSLEEDTSFLYKMTPPVRSKDDQHALWQGLAADVVDTVGTDHTPMSVDEKKPTQNLWDIVPGYPAVGTHLPSLLDSATKRHFPLTKLIEKMTANPAKIFGLYPQKGTILPGSDADLIVIDPHLEQVVTPEKSASRSDYCLHEGKALTGWPVGVIKSGKIITRPCFEHIKDFIRNRYLRRAGCQ